MTCRRLRLRDSRVCGSASDRRSFVRFGFRRTEPACEPLGGRLARPDQSRAGSASRARILEAAQASIRVCVTLPPSSVDLAHSRRQAHTAKPTPPSPLRQPTPPTHSANPLRQPTPPTHSANPLRQPAPSSHYASPTPPTALRQPTPPTRLRQARDCQFEERQPKCAKSLLVWKFPEKPLPPSRKSLIRGELRLRMLGP
jgi:hypothetical protein